MYDFFSVDFEFPGGVHIHAMCRQINGCWYHAGLHLIGERGITTCEGGLRPRRQVIPEDLPQARSGYQQEHIDLLYHLVKGTPLNEAANLACATATAIMGATQPTPGRRSLGGT